MKEKDFDELVESVKEGGRILRGRQRPSRAFDSASTVKDLRHSLKKSQDEFAAMIQVPVATVRNWEQGRRKPQGPALALLKIVAALPRKSLEILQRP